MHGSGVEFESSGAGFSHRLVNMYTDNIGEWARLLIALAAFLCIFGSTITVIDGCARVPAESRRLLFNRPKTMKGDYYLWLLIVAAGA